MHDTLDHMSSFLCQGCEPKQLQWEEHEASTDCNRRTYSDHKYSLSEWKLGHHATNLKTIGQ